MESRGMIDLNVQQEEVESKHESASDEFEIQQKQYNEMKPPVTYQEVTEEIKIDQHQGRNTEIDPDLVQNQKLMYSRQKLIQKRILKFKILKNQGLILRRNGSRGSFGVSTKRILRRIFQLLSHLQKMRKRQISAW